MQKNVAIITMMSLWVILYPHESMASYFVKLKSPYPSQTHILNNLKDTKAQCPNAPTAIQNMEYVSIYTDKSHGNSIVNPNAHKRYKAETASIQAYETQIYKWIENVLSHKTQDRMPIKCSIDWLYHWAQKSAMLEGTVSSQGEAVRKWTLASLSSQYIQIKETNWIDQKKKRAIESWLSDVTAQVMLDYKKSPKRTSRNNNHQYWAAWSVMITGILLNNRSYYKWGIQEYKKAMRQINMNGSLPLELDRESKAFHYHIFAVSPLIMIAETASKNGYNLYKYRQSALSKLINLILNELDHNQNTITQITGVKQNLTNTITRGQLSWLEVYQNRYNDKRTQKWINTFKPMIQRRIGGNLSRIYSTERASGG